MVRTSPKIAFDTETSGLSVRDFICGWVITDYEASVYVPVRHEAGGNIPDVEDFERELADAFKERTRLGYRTVGHHLGFDLRGSLRHGVVIGSPCEDTMINESLIDDLTKGYSLDDCCKRHGVTAKKGDELYRAIAERFGGIPDRKQMQHFWRMPGDDPTVVDYATGDGVSTLELVDSQQKYLDEEYGSGGHVTTMRRVWQLECDLLPYLARIHHRGLKIDPHLSERVGEHPRIMASMNEQIAEAEKPFPPGFNVRSGKEVHQLFLQNGFTDGDFAKTAGGQPSFAEKWLETNDIGKQILEVRRLMKARDSFITPLVDSFNVGGRVFPVLHQSKSDEYGVAGARLSCSEPNMQAFPKRNKTVGKVVRPLVVADDGMVIEEGDAVQQEPRLFAHYSEDPALLHGYQTEELDMHDRAAEILGLERGVAKRLGMGMLTMMSYTTLAGHVSCDIPVAKDYHHRFLNEAFPKIKEFQDAAKSVFANRGYVKTLLGRVARFDGNRHFAYRAVSRIIQNNGGDHIKTCILRACQYEDAFPDELQVLLSIHDSLIWQRDPGHAPYEFVRMLEQVVHEPQFDLKVNIPFEVGTGKNWSEASYSEHIKDKKGWHGDFAV